MKTIHTYLQSMKNENTRKANTALVVKLEDFCGTIGTTIETLSAKDLEEFLKINYTNSIVSSVYSTVSRLKKIFTYLENKECLETLNFSFTEQYLKPKRDRLYTPKEIVDRIDSLLNTQDKCIVLFCYLGLYDSNFETIRNLKETDLKGDTLYLPNGKKIKLSSYAKNIVKEAILENTYESYYPNNSGEYVTYELKPNTSHIIKGINASKTRDIVSAILVKKRIATFADFLGDKDFTPVAIKNSKTVYDFVYKEYSENNGNEINQLVLIDYCKENNIVGCIEHLNVIKKLMRADILNEIENNDDFICR